MKKIFYIFLCLALISLACLSTSSTANIDNVVDAPTLTTLTNASPSADDGPQTVFTAGPIELTCAVVIADEALHVREFANVDAIVLTWLNKNDVVEVLDQGINDWWKVRFNDVEGFARSSFLAEVECVK